MKLMFDALSVLWLLLAMVRHSIHSADSKLIVIFTVILQVVSASSANVATSLM